MAANSDNPKKKKRKRYGSYAWKSPSGYLYARVFVKNADGSVKPIYRRAENITHAEQIGEELKREFENRGQAFIDGRKMAFGELAEWYKKEFVISPVYVNGIKIEGMRTWEHEQNKIDRIVTGIGKKVLISEIDESTFRAFRKKRIKDGVSITTINRDFESIRAMMRKAWKKKWLKELPDFEDFIQKGLENRRTVTVTSDQEKVILEEARKVLTEAPRLYALIISLRDSGARPNELYPVNDSKTDYSKDTSTFFEPLRWRDLFDDAGQFKDLTQLVSYKNKRREVRYAVVTERMKRAFEELWKDLSRRKLISQNAAELDNLIFPHSTFKKSWNIVREAAGFPGLRLRDLRRDWVTRLGRLGYSDKLAQRGAGHKKMQTSFEYTEFDETAALQAKALLDCDNQTYDQMSLSEPTK
ncbi:MAG: phage integrase SAM-like domain-containing protein [Pyrinomonadaceae bacterium]|nr:phage integrase SAM-like domain-containing protein [Pyrinomonadaceae bacterium]